MDMIDVSIRKGQPKRLTRNLTILSEKSAKLAERIVKGESFVTSNPTNQDARKLLNDLKAEAETVKGFLCTLDEDYPGKIRELYAEGLFGPLVETETAYEDYPTDL